MIRIIILTACILYFCINSAIAKIDVVYPSSKEITINSPSVFFVGNVDKGNDFFINSNPVKLWQDNFFVYVIPLDFGKNEIKLTSKSNKSTEEIIYTITRNKPASYTGEKKVPEFIQKKDDEFLYTKTIKENATVREKPSTSSKRIIDLPLNVVLYLDGQQGDYYKISENGNFWIHKSNIQTPVIMKSKMNAKLKKTKNYSDELYNYTKFYLSHPVLYEIKQNGNSAQLILYGVETKEANEIQDYKYTFDFDKAVLGYECNYDDNNLICKIAKSPKNKNKELPLEGIKIFIDAGHGGSDKGAIGPTRIYEKDINLYISKYLAEYLKESGADVIMSRCDDTAVGLYERVKIAKSNDALISVSIHNNSLPNGKDPYDRHGTEVHYYNDNAKLLAEIINTNLAEDLSLKKGGIFKSSFALNRSTNPVSVLVECAYMINPEEYILLQNPEFQKQIAKSIKNSIEKYIIEIKN